MILKILVKFLIVNKKINRILLHLLHHRLVLLLKVQKTHNKTIQNPKSHKKLNHLIFM